MADTPRRLAYEEKREFTKVFNDAIRSGDRELFRLVLKQWNIVEGSKEWMLAWDAWNAERQAEHDAEKQRASKRGASRRAPRR
jgi:hypothetical protein